MYNDSVDALIYSVRMVVDSASLGVMQFVADKMGVDIDISARAGQRYSSRGGDCTSVVPKGYCHVTVNPVTDQIKDFWDKVSKEKTRRKLVLEASAAAST